jgi:type IV pilus assembly protein PilY1
MSGRQLKWAAAAITMATSVALHAQIAQDPLQARTAAVEPNIVFIFDDSASMVSTAIYQFGGGAGYQGNRGPNNDTECLASQSGCIWTNPPTTFYGRSPDVNLIYYDPRVAYKRRIKADGTSMAPGSTSGINSWNVYFWKGAVPEYAAKTVGVTTTGTGYNAGVTAAFTPPPFGGTQATASVQTTTNYGAGSVTVTNGGFGYGSSVGATLNAAPSAGVTGSVTVQTSDSYSVATTSSFTLASRGYGFPASGVTAVFDSPATGGIQATVSAVTTQLTKQLSSVTMLTPGACLSTMTITVSAPAVAGGVQGAVAAVQTPAATPTTNGPVTGFNIVTAGSGYATAAPPSLTFTGCAVNPTYTIALQDTYMLGTIALGSPGAGYVNPPVLTINAGSGAGYAVNVATTTTKTITGITVVDPGAGYTSPPTVSLTNTGGGTGFTATVIARTSYAISGINVTATGGGYLVPPTLTLGNTGGGSGATFSYTYTSAVVNGVNSEWDGSGTPTTSASYFTPGYTPDANSPLAVAATRIAYPNTANSGTALYPKFIGRTDCTTTATGCTWAEELQNYANWKLYHSTRIELAKTGVGLAFQPLNPTFRLGWGTLGELAGCTNSGSGALNKGVRLFDGTTQGDFLTWLYAIQGNVLCTPSRWALNNVGKYYQRQDSAGPWADAPGGDGAISRSGVDSSHASCRRSYSMLMTDGYYNDSFPSFGDYDSTNGPNITQPRAFQYTPTGPFSDNVSSSVKASNTLADVAMKYWLTDLRPDLNNNIKPVPGDTAYWQHMNFYAIGLGLVGSLDATDPAVLQSLTGNSPARTKSWPTPNAGGNDVFTIDDMWHATLNGHGKILNAKTAAQLNSAIQQMMSDIGGKEGTQSGVAVSTISLTKDTRKYTPSYTPISWDGNVTAYNLDQTNASQASIAWQVETLVSVDPVTSVKTYSSRMPVASVRNIFVGNGSTSGTRAVAFTYPAMSAAGLLASMGSTGINNALIDYLRGDPANEDTDTTGAAATGIYRPRQTRLGDIVNSTPVFVKDSIDLSYEKLPISVPGQGTYRTFVSAKKARVEGALFVGANDGMLHVFRDGTYGANDLPIIPGGVEVFAYVPNAVLPALSNLSNKVYTHQYYVDGPNAETDAYLGSKSRWANIVLGSTGAGAGVPSSAGTSPRSAVYALDATSLNTSVTGMDATSVLWEVSSSNSSFRELGYVLTDIQAGVTVGGQWIAVFGNGYESKSCQARLYVVDLDTGALVKEINTNAGNCSGSKNGLGGVRLVRNASQQVVGAYAGDLLGNMWKFNLNNTSVSNWGVDLANAPLYTAGTAKPITAPPTVITLPIVGTTDPATGYMVVFGTGKFYEVADISNTATQTLYGVWDPLLFGVTPIPVGTALTASTTLVQQTVTGPQTVAATGNTYFGISTNAVTYTGATPKRGWFINQPNTGQRNVYPLDLLADRFIAADTIAPSAAAVDPCANQSGGTGYFYIIDAVSGAGPTQAVLDTNGDGNVDSQDLVVSGLQGAADGRNVSIVVSKNDLATTYANVGGGAPGATIIKIACALTNTCGVTLPGVRHQWRQLFLR